MATLDSSLRKICELFNEIIHLRGYLRSFLKILLAMSVISLFLNLLGVAKVSFSKQALPQFCHLIENGLDADTCCKMVVVVSPLLSLMSDQKVFSSKKESHV